MPALNARPAAKSSAVKSNERKCALGTNIAREAALAFLDADANNDGILDWPEFKHAVSKLRSKDGTGVLSSDDPEDDDYDESLLALFNSIDNNGNGTIEMDEYFLWTLDVATQQGCGLESLFKKVRRLCMLVPLSCALPC